MMSLPILVSSAAHLCVFVYCPCWPAHDWKPGDMGKPAGGSQAMSSMFGSITGRGLLESASIGGRPLANARDCHQSMPDIGYL